MDGSRREWSSAHGQWTPIDSALTTKPIAGIHWTANTAFVHHNDADHLALPLVIRFAREMRRSMSGKKPSLKEQICPVQLELLRSAAILFSKVDGFDYEDPRVSVDLIAYGH
jgi:hypothetical protein